MTRQVWDMPSSDFGKPKTLHAGSLLNCNLLDIFFFSLIYLFMAALGLHCCARAFSSCGKRGLLFAAMHRLLIAVASLVAEHGLQACIGFSSCGSQAQ